METNLPSPICQGLCLFYQRVYHLEKLGEIGGWFIVFFFYQHCHLSIRVSCRVSLIKFWKPGVIIEPRKIQWLYPLGRIILWEGHGFWASNKIWRPSAAWPSDPWRNPAWGSVGVRCHARFPAHPKWPAHPPSCNSRWGSPACRPCAQTPPLSRAAWRGPPAPFGTWRGGRRAVAFGMPATCAPAGRCPPPTRAAATPAGSGTGLAAAVVGLSQHRPPKGCVRYSTRGWVDLPTAPPRKRTMPGPPPWRGSDGWCKPPTAFVSRIAVAACLTPAELRHPALMCEKKKKIWADAIRR